MQSLHTFKVRDNRRKNFFIVDNVFLEDYASVLGSIASMIYIYLCKCADNKTQESFPSQQTIAEKVGTTRQTVNEKLALLEEYQMVSITNVFDEKTGARLNNVYTLLDQSEWKTDHVSQGYIPPITSDDTVTHDPLSSETTTYNNTHNINKTHIENFGEKNNHIQEENTEVGEDTNSEETFLPPNKRKAIKGKRKFGFSPTTEPNQFPYKGFKERRRGGVDFTKVI